MSACSFLKRGQLKVAEKGLSAAGWWSHSRHEIKCIDFLSAHPGNFNVNTEKAKKDKPLFSVAVHLFTASMTRLSQFIM